MPFMAHRAGSVRGVSPERRVSNPLCTYNRQACRMSVLREAYVDSTQLPSAQDTMYGVAWPSHYADTEDAPHGMHEQRLREEVLCRASSDDASLWAPYP